MNVGLFVLFSKLYLFQIQKVEGAFNQLNTQKQELKNPSMALKQKLVSWILQNIKLTNFTSDLLNVKSNCRDNCAKYIQ